MKIKQIVSGIGLLLCCTRLGTAAAPWQRGAPRIDGVLAGLVRSHKSVAAKMRKQFVFAIFVPSCGWKFAGLRLLDAPEP